MVHIRAGSKKSSDLIEAVKVYYISHSTGMFFVDKIFVECWLAGKILIQMHQLELLLKRRRPEVQSHTQLDVERRVSGK